MSGPTVKPTLTSKSSTGSSRSPQLAINQWTTRNWSLEKDLEGYQNAGIPAIGLSRWKLLELDEDEAVERLLQSELEISSLGWLCGFTGANGYSYQDALLEAEEQIIFASLIGAPTITVMTGDQGGHIRPHAKRLLIEALSYLGDIAAEHDVELALQPMSPGCDQQWSFLHTLRDTLDVLNKVDRDSVGMSFHTYHLWQDQDLHRLMPEAASRTKIVRIADWSCVPRHECEQQLPGDGRIQLQSMIGALHRGGYRGYYEVDVWSEKLWKQPVDHVLSRCRQFGHLLQSLPDQSPSHM